MLALDPISPRKLPRGHSGFSAAVLDGRRKVAEWHGPDEVIKRSLRNALMRYFYLAGPGSQSLAYNDDGGVARNVAPATNNAVTAASHHHSSAGLEARLKFGSGSTAPQNTDNNIETQLGTTIALGHKTDADLYDDSAFTVTLRGSQQNTSGGSWTVREIAAFLDMVQNDGAATRVFMLDRSSVSPALTVANNQTLNIKYTWSF